MLSQLDDVKWCAGVSLASGNIWCFTCCDKLKGWLDIFIYMASLDYGCRVNDYVNKFIFIEKKDSNKLPSHFVRGSFVEPCKNLYSRIWQHPSHKDIYVELNVDRIFEAGMEIMTMFNVWKIIHKHYTDNGSTPFHAAFAELDNKGILITAPGSTGKTTSYHRLPNYWNKYADDLALVVKAGGDNYNVHPLPTWSDYVIREERTTFRVEHSVPLKGIFFLEQSNKDEVEEINQGIAVMEIFNSLKSNSERLLPRMDNQERQVTYRKLLDTSIDLAKTIPCYRLKATLHGEFWKEIEKVL